MLYAGSLVFRKPPGRVDLLDIRNWWSFTKGADWRHQVGPDSQFNGLKRHPVVHVAYRDREAYAKWAGKEITTEAEWEFAARGGLEQDSYNPSQPAIKIPRKVLKGGSHLCAANYCRRCRPAARFPEPVDTSACHVGFRLIVRPSKIDYLVESNQCIAHLKDIEATSDPAEGCLAYSSLTELR